MRISVTRSGGFTGITRRATLDTAGREDAGELTTLAHDALAAVKGEPPAGVPDGFHYEIEVDGQKGHCAEPRLTEAQSALVRLVLKEGS